MNKYGIFGVIVVVCVITDIWTKTLAERNLASRTQAWEHSIERTVSDSQDGMTVEEWVVDELNVDLDDDNESASADAVYREAREGSPPLRLARSTVLQAGQELEIKHRSTTIMKGFWSHSYARNPGAAFGLLANAGENVRRPFFVVVSILAIIIVMMIFRNVEDHQRWLIVALALIVGGAMGNFIDRVRYGYVVDFIEWAITWKGEVKRWPTFNVADSWISIGVVLLALQIIFGNFETEEEPVESEGLVPS